MFFMKIKGVLFDMDGVLVDSEWFICEAAVRMFAELGLIVERDDFLPFVGAGENRYIGGVAEKYNFDVDIEKAKARVYAIYHNLIPGKLEALPGVAQFISLCRSRGLKLALATSADKTKMDANLLEIGLSDETFDVKVNGLDVERKKPYPDIYLYAADKLGLKAEECLVVEDAVNGIEAGYKAGARTLALTTSFDAAHFPDADWIAEDLSEAPEEAISW
jgi:HAD superfamily hydrolase (TIGR01509 family)